jgi:ABC-type polysaccharide/polyol phosphate export permease
VYDARDARPGLPADFSTAVRGLFEFRGLFVELVRRDLLIRYKQTLIGVAWAVVVPFSAMLVFAMVFTRAVPVETEIPYPLFAYSGLLAWNLLATSLRTATTSLTLNHALVTKVAFPRGILPLSTIAVALVDFLVASVILGGMMVYYGVPPSGLAVLLPLVLLAELALVAGLSLLLALAHLFYRDVGYIVGLGLLLWMFATSVVYPVELVGGRLGALLRWNPMNPIIETFRAALFGGTLPGAPALLGTALGSLALLAGAIVWFHRLEPRFAEAI